MKIETKSAESDKNIPLPHRSGSEGGGMLSLKKNQF